MSLRQAAARIAGPYRTLRAASTSAQPTASTSSAPPPPLPSSTPSPAAAAPPAPAPSSAPSPSPSSSSSTLLQAADSTDPSPVFGRHAPLPQTHGVHVATLHLRSYTDSVPDLQFFTQFALRAARALGLPTSGAVALPTRTSLYTVPRSPFAHKKSQQNFWRKEHKRAIKVWDGNPAVVDAWLAYLRREALGGVGMKAQVFTYRDVGWGKDLVSQKEAEAHALAQQSASFDEGGDAGAAEVERLARELEEELKAGIDEAERAESAADLEAPVEAEEAESPVVEAAKELKEAEANGEDVAGKDVPVKGE
ncbi:mitochondrial 37S ribosomal protein rsm10 [Rhodotorula kratochvilovae]